jgi:hypothetical protein
MVAAFLVDLGLVLYIEISRYAMEEVVSTNHGMVLWFHAPVSTLGLAAYVGQITLARLLLAVMGASRRMHIVTGVSLCGLRILNRLTSFML